MRKLVYLFLAMIISIGSYAQKGNVGKAEGYLSKGELANAKAEIDVAITIEKNAAKSRTWFTRGKIYKSIAFSENEADKALDDDAITKAVESYRKVQSLDSETTPNHLLAGNAIEEIWSKVMTDGGAKYGEPDYNGAYDRFLTALEIKPEDSITLLYCGVTAQQLESWDKTAEHYYKMVDLGMASSDIFTTLIYIERTRNKDDIKGLEVIRKAREAFPSESKFGQEEISVLIALDKLDEAKSQLEAAIAEDPTNPSNYLNLGIMYDNIGAAQAEEGKDEEARKTIDLAKSNYEKAIENDPDSYIGNFNLGAIYVNLAKEFYDKVRDMDLKTYDKEGPAIVEKADGILKKGLPFMQKANEVKPNDINGLKALSQMYQQLKMMDEAEAVLNKIDELEAGG